MFRKFVGYVSSCLAVSAALVTARAQAQTNCPQEVRLKIQQLDQQAEVYRQYQTYYCQNPQLQQACSQIRTWLQSYYPSLRQQLLSQCNQPPPPQQGCTRDFCGEAQRKGQGWLQAFQGVPNRYSRTYRIEFSYRPDYQSQCDWIPSRNGYTVSGWEFQRTVSSLMNRCNLIRQVSYY